MDSDEDEEEKESDTPPLPIQTVLPEAPPQHVEEKQRFSYIGLQLFNSFSLVYLT